MAKKKRKKLSPAVRRLRAEWRRKLKAGELPYAYKRYPQEGTVFR